MHHRYLFALVAALAPRLLHAATATYTGPDNGLWSDDWNWSTFQIPTFTTDVLLSSPSFTTTRLTSSAECNSLVISPNNILDASSSGSFTVYHTLLNDGLLRLGPSSYSPIGFVASGNGTISLANASCAFGVANSNAITGSGGISFYNLTNTGNITAGPSNVLGISGENFTNAASILADSGTITLVSSYPASFTNTGTITAAGSGVINVPWTTSLSGGTLLARDNASITLQKAVSNAVIAASGNATIALSTIENCTLSAASPSSFLFQVDSTSQHQRNVTFQGPFSLGIAIFSGTITSQGSLATGPLFLDGDTTLAGSGAISLPSTIDTTIPSARLTNNAPNTTYDGFLNNAPVQVTNNATLTFTKAAYIQLAQSPSSFINAGTLRVASSAFATFYSPLNNANGLIDLAPGATLTCYAPILNGGTLRLAANPLARHNYYQHVATAPFTSTLSSLLLAGSPGNWQATLDIDNNALALTPAPQDKSAGITTAADQINSGLRYYYTGPGITSYTVAGDMSRLTIALADNADLHLPSFLGTPLDPNALLITAALKGDANLDGYVDLADYDLWFKHVGNPGLLTSRGDFNLDNQIDLSDYDTWYQHVGATFSLSPYGIPNSPIPIPEPATFAMPLFALLLCRAKRR